MFKAKCKKEVDDILDEVRKDCHAQIDSSKVYLDAMQLIRESLGVPKSKIVQGSGYINRDKVQFSIGDGESIPLFAEFYTEED